MDLQFVSWMKGGIYMASSWDNVSILFKSLNTSNNLNFNFSDYNSIRNGSYKKLVKAYYAESDTSNKASSTTKKKNTDTDTTGLTKMKKEADSLKKSADSLSDSDMWKMTNGSYDTDKIVSAVKDFAEDYNSVIEQSKKVDNKNVSQYTSYMTSLGNTLSGSLSKIGISFETNGKMSVDEDTLKNADSKNLKSLLSGTNSYAGQVAQKASNISSSALRSTSIYSENGTLSSMLNSTYTSWM